MYICYSIYGIQYIRIPQSYYNVSSRIDIQYIQFSENIFSFLFLIQHN